LRVGWLKILAIEGVLSAPVVIGKNWELIGDSEVCREMT